MVNAILDRIAVALADGDHIELRDFGTFGTRETRLRTVRNPRMGQAVAVEAKQSIQFKPGKGLRARLNTNAGIPHAVPAAVTMTR
ncbi:HU family DNA-binding protein [Methylobacterium sp. E-005]|uniref:HU family DNA-binding protein n=1 Tax=Methylobacterium sp. E-005 TaxID=2836549 RepID=UPI0028C40088|nr:HU family DNA-binding protein [Methylobacterium sp. E-005]